MEFGITFKGFIEAERARYLVRMAEYAGFDYCWFYDSHILWRDCYAAIAMCMEHTQKMRFGPLVTNPDVRDWSVAASIFGSLSKQSGGRFDLAVGRGDSSMRVMGKKPATLARVAEFIRKTQAMVRGDYQNDRAFRVQFQQWMNALWQDKDADIARMLGPGDRAGK